MFDVPITRAAGDYDRTLAIGDGRITVDRRDVTLNVTEAVGALLCEIGFPVPVMHAAAVVSHAAGLVAHIYEEKREPVTPSVVEYVNAVPFKDPE